MTGVSIQIISDDEDGIRLDRWFRQRYPTVGHGQLQKMLRKGQVRLDGGRVKANDRVAAGQEVRVPPITRPDDGARLKQREKTPVSDETAEFIQSMVIYQDKDLYVLDKPAGLAVQGGSRTYRHIDGMLDALVAPGAERPKLVHRLDKDTSGCLVVARTAKSARKLTESFKSKKAEKLYWAAVSGVPSPGSGRVDLALAKAPGKGVGGARELMVPDDENGKRAITYYETLEKAGREVAWVAFYPTTGRTHQLRVHANAIGNPIIGDGKYGGDAAFPLIDGVGQQLHLHARALRIPHPQGGHLEVSSPLPPHMRQTWAALGFLENDHAASIQWPELG